MEAKLAKYIQPQYTQYIQNQQPYQNDLTLTVDDFLCRGTHYSALVKSSIYLSIYLSVCLSVYLYIEYSNKKCNNIIQN